MKDITPDSTWDDVQLYACEVFGREVAMRWINKPLRRFGGSSMKTAFAQGQQVEVVELLLRSTYGFVF